MKTTSFVVPALLIATLGLSAGAVSAQTCSVDIASTDAMKFDKDVIAVDKNCKDFTVNLTHSGKLAKKVMGHNWVLSEAANVQGAAIDGMKAGLENDYVKPDDARVIAFTEVIGGGEKTSVTFSVDKLDASAEYTFFCSFPGHWSVMRGTLSVK